MKTRLQELDTDLVLHLPKSFAKDAGLDAGIDVEIKIADGVLVIMPSPDYDLDDLLAGVTDENRHGEVDTGASIGNEIW